MTVSTSTSKSSPSAQRPYSEVRHERFADAYFVQLEPGELDEMLKEPGSIDLRAAADALHAQSE